MRGCGHRWQEIDGRCQSRQDQHGAQKTSLGLATDGLRISLGHMTDRLWTDYGQATNTLRKSHGRTTDKPRTCYGRTTSNIRTCRGHTTNGVRMRFAGCVENTFLRTLSYATKLYRCTRPVALPAARDSTSATVTWLKSCSMECLRQDAATAKSIAACGFFPVASA